jgi:HEAT repeat protein
VKWISLSSKKDHVKKHYGFFMKMNILSFKNIILASVTIVIISMGVIVAGWSYDHECEIPNGLDQSTQSVNNNQIIDLLIMDMSSNNPKVKRDAFHSLGKIGGKASSALPAMINAFDEALINSDFETASAAMIPLALVSAYNIEPLVKYAKNTKQKDWGYILSIIANIGDPRLTPILLDYLMHTKSMDSVDHRITLCAFDFIPDSRAFVQAISMLNAKDSEVQRTSIMVLVRLNDSRALKPLCELYENKPVSEVKPFLASAMGHFQARQFADEFLHDYALLKPDDDLNRRQYASALSDLGDIRAFELIKEDFLNKKIHGEARIAFGEALNKLPDLRKLDVFFNAWKDEQQNYLVRIYSAMRLVESCSPHQFEAAEWILKNCSKDKKVAIIKMLGKKLNRHYSTAIIRLLNIALEDKAKIVRYAAQVELELDKMRDEIRDEYFNSLLE